MPSLVGLERSRTFANVRGPVTATLRPTLLGVRVAVALLILGLEAPPAHAAGKAATADKAEARRHFQVGVAEAQAGAYREAAIEFSRAYELSPNFAVLYNLAQAQAALGDAATALTTFERYLAEGGMAVPEEKRAKVARETKELVARTGSIVAHVAPETARLTIDGAEISRASMGRALRVNVGVHKLAASDEGHVPAEQVVTVASSDTANVSIVLAADAAPRPNPAPPPAAVERPPSTTPSLAARAPVLPASPPFRLVEQQQPAAPEPVRSNGTVQRTIGYLVGAVGLAGLVTGGVLYGVARTQAQNAVNNGCTQDLATCRGNGANQWSSSQNGIRNARIAAGIGGGLVVAGAIVVLAAPSPSGAPAAVALVGRW